MSRIWRPAKVCPHCHYPNDDCAIFCQQCGVAQTHIGATTAFSLAQSKLDIQAIDNRIQELQSARILSQYGRQKSQLEVELQGFLKALNPQQTVFSCQPKDVVRFLVWKDRNGRTKVHMKDCKFLGSKNKGPCDCPSRLSAGTVDSTVGKLRSIFNALDRSGDYDVRSGGGNPAAHFLVKQYLKSVQAEQAQARISPRQATPIFFDKFHKIVLHVRELISNPAATAIDKYIYARDLAFFTLEFVTGQRASDLGRLKTMDILQDLEGKNLLINQRIGKSLRDGIARPIPVRPSRNPAICPIENLKFYRALCTAMRISLGTGFLFRTTIKHTSVSSSPFLAPAAQARLVTYLKSLGLYTNETIHGFRGGTAILLGLLGASKADIAGHIGWHSTDMVDHYTQADKVLALVNTSDKLSGSTLPVAGRIPAEDLGTRFKQCNSLVGFKLFFTT